MDSSPYEPEGLSENLLGPSYDLEQPGHGHLSRYEPLTTATWPQPHSSDSNNVSAGSKQPVGYRDIGPGLLFIGHIVSLVYMAVVWGLPSLHYQLKDDSKTPMPDRSIYYNDDDVTTTTISFGGGLLVTTLSSFVSLIMTAAVLWVLKHYLSHMIQFSLGFSVAANAVMIIYFGLHQLWTGVFLSTTLLVVGIIYARAVWKRVPFATANLTSAVAALQSNAGVAFVAFACVGVFCLYVYVFLLAWLGVYLRSANCHPRDDYCDSNMSVLWGMYFVLSFYWTAHVVKNVLNVTVAGVVGTFFFCPEEASQFCSPAIMDSVSRATTFSFGSVCLGSFMTAIIQVLHAMAREASRHGRGSTLVMCVLQCLLGFLDRLVMYFNRYALTYVGLYGYDYLTAGKKTADLIGARGWTLILNDDLVGRVLALLNLVIGGLTGACGLYLATLHPSWTEEYGSAEVLVAFGFPFLVGTAMSSVLLGVVSSAVDTILVAFCEAPMDFERNHPGLHRQMTLAWQQVYPDASGSYV